MQNIQHQQNFCTFSHITYNNQQPSFLSTRRALRTMEGYYGSGTSTEKVTTTCTSITPTCATGGFGGYNTIYQNKRCYKSSDIQNGTPKPSTNSSAAQCPVAANSSNKCQVDTSKTPGVCKDA